MQTDTWHAHLSFHIEFVGLLVHLHVLYMESTESLNILWSWELGDRVQEVRFLLKTLA